MRISDWSLDVCSSDLFRRRRAIRYPDWRQLFETRFPELRHLSGRLGGVPRRGARRDADQYKIYRLSARARTHRRHRLARLAPERHHPSVGSGPLQQVHRRSEEHTSELQSLMRISYAVFCLKKKKKHSNTKIQNDQPTP